MFDDLMDLTQTSSMDFAYNLSSWNHNIFLLLIIVEFLVISITYILKPDQIEQLPIKLALLGITAGIGGVLFMYLPEIWVMGWTTVQHIVKESSGTGTLITPNPSDFLNQAFSIVGSLGGIFVVMYVFKTTRPCFQSYIKYMCGLLLKTLGLFMMVAMLTVYLNSFTSYDSNIGSPPSMADCQEVIDIQQQLQNCTDTQCKIDITPRLNSAQKLCTQAKQKYNAWQIQTSHGFIERGLVLILVLFIFVTMIKTIPNVMASLVGFGDYSIHGMGHAMGAVAMGAGAAKLLQQSNPAQAMGGAVGSAAGGVASGVGRAAGGAASGLGNFAGGLANKQGDGLNAGARFLGKGMQYTGGAAKKAGSHIGATAEKAGSKAADLAKWSVGSKDEEAAKAGRRKLVNEVTKQFNNKG